MPRTYLLDDYLRDSGSRRVEGLVWHEFLSADPVREVRWGQALAGASPIPQAIVALVESRDSGLEERLDALAGEQDRLFRGTATAWFGLDRLDVAVGSGRAARTDGQH